MGKTVKKNEAGNRRPKRSRKRVIVGGTRCPECFVRLAVSDDDHPDDVIVTHRWTSCIKNPKATVFNKPKGPRVRVGGKGRRPSNKRAA